MSAPADGAGGGQKSANGKLKVGSLRRVDELDERGEVEACWCNVPGASFETRIGPGYAQNKKKDNSRPCLYECRAIDIYVTDTKISHVARLMDLPGDHLDDSGNDGYLPQTFVVNCQIPNYPVENMLWGRCAGDGQGYSLIFYFTLSDYGRAQVAKRGNLVSAADDPASEVFGMLPKAGAGSRPSSASGNAAAAAAAASSSAAASPATPSSSMDSMGSAPYYQKDDPACFESDTEPCDASVRLLHNFVAAEEGSDLRQRFKGITRLMNVNEAGLGQATRTVVNRWNGTPFLIRTCSVFWRGDTYFEVDVDVHRFSYAARVGLSGVRERIKDCVFDFGFVIEGHSDFELPENMLGAVRFSKLDLSLAPPFPA